MDSRWSNELASLNPTLTTLSDTPESPNEPPVTVEPVVRPLLVFEGDTTVYDEFPSAAKVVSDSMMHTPTVAHVVTSETSPLIAIDIRDMDLENRRYRTSLGCTERAKRVGAMWAAILPYLMLFGFLVALGILIGSLGHRAEKRNLTMMGRAIDPTKPRWYQLIRLASGIELKLNGDFNADVEYENCTTYQASEWVEADAVTMEGFLSEHPITPAPEHLWQRAVYAMVLPEVDPHSLVCPASLYFGPNKPEKGSV